MNNMTTVDIEEKVAEILGQLSADLDMDRDKLMQQKIADLDLDSMDVVTLLFDIEEALEIDIDINDLDTQMSLSELINTNAANKSSA